MELPNCTHKEGHVWKILRSWPGGGGFFGVFYCIHCLAGKKRYFGPGKDNGKEELMDVIKPDLGPDNK